MKDIIRAGGGGYRPTAQTNGQSPKGGSGIPGRDKLPPSNDMIMVINNIQREQEKQSAFWMAMVKNVNHTSEDIKHLAGDLDRIKDVIDIQQNIMGTLVYLMINALGIEREDFAKAWHSVNGEQPDEEMLDYLFGEILHEEE